LGGPVGARSLVELQLKFCSAMKLPSWMRSTVRFSVRQRNWAAHEKSCDRWSGTVSAGDKSVAAREHRSAGRRPNVGCLMGPCYSPPDDDVIDSTSRANTNRYSTSTMSIGQTKQDEARKCSEATCGGPAVSAPPRALDDCTVLLLVVRLVVSLRVRAWASQNKSGESGASDLVSAMQRLGSESSSQETASVAWALHAALLRHKCLDPAQSRRYSHLVAMSRGKLAVRMRTLRAKLRRLVLTRGVVMYWLGAQAK